MTVSQAANANSPCSVIRTLIAGIGDGDTQFIRVGGEGAPMPANDAGPYGADSEAYNNPVFFQKLKDAARRLTGATTDEQLSAAEIPIFYCQLSEAWESVIQGSFPNGKALRAPLFESITHTLGPTSLAKSFFIAFSMVFEDTGGETPPRYVDFKMTIDDSVETLLLLTFKLFHSLTT